MTVAGSLPSRTGEKVAEVSRTVARFQNFMVAALLIGFMIMGWVGRAPLEIGAGDDVIYLSLSRSLEAGSYREIYRASAPLQTKYPPGYPAWLVLVRHLTGGRLDAVVVANLILVALALLLLFGIARHFAGGWFALALLLLMVLSHGILWMGGSLYSEGLFLLLSTASLAAMLSDDRTDSRASYAAIGFALLAFLTRLAGLSLVLAVGIWLWPRRMELLVYGLSSMLVVGGWFGYAALASSSQTVRSYGSDFSAGGHGAAAAGARGALQPLARLASRTGHVALSYGTEVLPSELSELEIPGTHIDNWGWLGVNILLLGTGLVVLWRRWRAAAAYLIVYAGVLVTWPWAIGRLLDAVLPLVLLTILFGAWHLAQRLPIWVRGPALGLFVAVLALGAVKGAAERIARYSQCDRRNPFTSAGCFSDDKRSVVAAAEYMRTHISEGDVVLAWRPSDVQFLSGRLGEHAAVVGDAPEGIARELRSRSIRHVLLTPMFAYERGPLANALLASCAEFLVEGRFVPHTLLLATQTPGEANPDACDALRLFVRENPPFERPL